MWFIGRHCCFMYVPVKLWMNHGGFDKRKLIFHQRNYRSSWSLLQSSASYQMIGGSNPGQVLCVCRKKYHLWEGKSWVNQLTKWVQFSKMFRNLCESRYSWYRIKHGLKYQEVVMNSYLCKSIVMRVIFIRVWMENYYFMKITLFYKV